jgi:hypothetical protein
MSEKRTGRLLLGKLEPKLGTISCLTLPIPCLVVQLALASKGVSVARERR